MTVVRSTSCFMYVLLRFLQGGVVERRTEGYGLLQTCPQIELLSAQRDRTSAERERAKVRAGSYHTRPKSQANDFEKVQGCYKQVDFAVLPRLSGKNLLKAKIVTFTVKSSVYYLYTVHLPNRIKVYYNSCLNYCPLRRHLSIILGKMQRQFH